MNPGIYYLYEYKNNHRMRNTGFLKLTKKPDCWLLQIQARNIPVTNQHLVPLCAILTKQEHSVSKKISELPCNSHIISAQLTLPDSAIDLISSMENLHGFLILLPDESFLTATESQFHLDINEIFSTTVQPETLKPVPEPAPDLSASEYNDNNNLFEASDTTNLLSPSKTIQKIHRSDLKILPKKCWNLANNSFLLHGYHNYHHLLLIEENGHYQLGVPGVYDIREARAAEIFGFPKFIDSYNDQLELSSDECNTQETFGYWCHYIY